LEEGRLGFLGEMEDMQLDIQVPEEDKEQRAIQQKEEDKEQEDRLGWDQEEDMELVRIQEVLQMELVGIQEVLQMVLVGILEGLQMVLVGIRGGRQLLVGMAKEQRRKGSEEQLDRKADTVSQTSFREPCLL